MKQRKVYNRSFKENAVKLSYERDNMTQFARELGISVKQFYVNDNIIPTTKLLRTFLNDALAEKQDVSKKVTLLRSLKILPKWYTFQVESGPFFNYYMHLSYLR